jgi:hypothetical protein
VRVDGTWNTLCALFHHDDRVRVLDGTARRSEPYLPRPLSRPPRSTSKSSSIRRRSISPAKERICNIGAESVRHGAPLSPLPGGSEARCRNRSRAWSLLHPRAKHSNLSRTRCTICSWPWASHRQRFRALTTSPPCLEQRFLRWSAHRGWGGTGAARRRGRAGRSARG